MRQPITVTTDYRHLGTLAVPARFRRADVLAFEFWHAGTDGWRAFFHLRDGGVVRLRADQAEIVRVYGWFTGRTIPLAELRRRSVRRELSAWRDSWERLLPDVQRRIAALEAELATLPEWRHCHCGRPPCPTCGGCATMEIRCGWCSCGAIRAEEQLAAIEEHDRKARLRRMRAA